MFIQCKDKTGIRTLINTDFIVRITEEGKSMFLHTEDNLSFEIENTYIWTMNQLAAAGLVFKVEKDAVVNPVLKKDFI